MTERDLSMDDLACHDAPAGPLTLFPLGPNASSVRREFGPVHDREVTGPLQNQVARFLVAACDGYPAVVTLCKEQRAQIAELQEQVAGMAERIARLSEFTSSDRSCEVMALTDALDKEECARRKLEEIVVRLRTAHASMSADELQEAIPSIIGGC
jgi:cell division septum initiation protein DivIVA